MGAGGGGGKVDRMEAPYRITVLEGGAAQCPRGSRRVYGNLREEETCPKGRNILLLACCLGRPAHIDEHGTRLVGVLLDRDANPIGLPQGRGDTHKLKPINHLIVVPKPPSSLRFKKSFLADFTESHVLSFHRRQRHRPL